MTKAKGTRRAAGARFNGRQPGGHRTAAQVLTKEIEKAKRRVERIEEERVRLSERGQCGPLMSEHFRSQLDTIRREVVRLEEELVRRKDEVGAMKWEDK